VNRTVGTVPAFKSRKCWHGALGFDFAIVSWISLRFFVAVL